MLTGPQHFYAEPAGHTDAGSFRGLLGDLPPNIQAQVETVQGLILYDVVAHELYGLNHDQDWARSIHLRHTRDMLAALGSHDPPLCRRHPRERIAGRCSHYALLLTTMLRHHGIPARARCGFADYFNPGHYEDHWLCEYWDHTDERWISVDAQLDETWRIALDIDFNHLVSRVVKALRVG